jgi:CelD/BcsL family acetyltransferase involved in cellulose biosynthesis
MISRIDAGEFGRLAADWDALLQASRSNCLFLTWEWLHAWWSRLAERRELFLLRVTSGDELTGLLPLAFAPAQLSRCSPRSLEFLGGGAVGSDYLDFIIRDGREAEAMSEAGNYLFQQKIPLRLSQTRTLAAAARLADYWRHKLAPLREERSNVCPVIDLAGHDWDSYLATLGAEHRYNFRRKLKQLTRRFEVRFELVRCEQERRAALTRLIELHNLRRSFLGGSSAFHTADALSFHEEVSRTALERGWLRLFMLWLDDRLAAALYGFLYNSVFYFYQSGFDPRFGGFSVGLVMMGLAIRSAIEEGAREYDMLHGAERYKFHWANGVRDLTCLELYPPGIRGELWRHARGWNVDLRTMARKMLSGARMAAPPAATLTGREDSYIAGRR